MDSAVHLRVRVAGPFSAELENCPIISMLVVKKLDKLVGRISIGLLWPY